MQEPPLERWEREEALRMVQWLVEELPRVGPGLAWDRLDRLTTRQVDIVLEEVIARVGRPGDG